MGVILSAAYIVAKGSDLLQRIRFLKRSFIKFLQKTVIPQNVPYLKLLITLKKCTFSHSELCQQKSKYKLLEERVQSAMTITAILSFSMNAVTFSVSFACLAG